MTEQGGEEVTLVVYDLSRGMARSLSGQFLGPSHQIDIIPHTALVVFGKEYYFGQGINCEDPIVFRSSRQMSPIQSISLGRTEKTKYEFDSWCQLSTKYTPTSYDLLQNNCNNFSNDAALYGLGLTQGVPSWILQVPQTFLSSPMGQLLRPMLEQMQLTNSSNNTSTNPWNTSPVQSTPTATAGNNPWATMNNNDNETSDTVTAGHDVVHTSTEKKTPSLIAVETPILDSLCHPLLSKDVNTVNICISKLVKSKCLEQSSQIQTKLQRLGQDLMSSEKSTFAQQDLEFIHQFLDIITQCGTKTDLTFALMIIRLVVIRYNDDQQIRSTISTKVGQLIISSSQKQTESKNHHHMNVPSVRSMAWCVLSNYIGTSTTDTFCKIENKFLTNLTEVALQDLSMERVEIRQSTAAFLYNLILLYYPTAKCEDELNDGAVNLLCGSLEDIDTEADETVKLRRLLVCGKILKNQTASRTLLIDLEYKKVLQTLAENDASNKIQQLAAELITLLS